MRSPFTLIAVALLGTTMLPALGPVHAADLDHPYHGSGRDAAVRSHRVRQPVVVAREIEVVPVPLPAPPPPDNGPYGPFTYFPTHAPNYGYGY